MKKLFTVSEETNKLLECMHELNEHREKTFEALQATYHAETALNKLTGVYDPVFIQMKEALQVLFIDMVEMQLEQFGDTLKKI